MPRKHPPHTPRKGVRVERVTGRPKWADEFIRELRSNGGCVTNAAPAAGVSVRSAYDFRYENAEFEAQWIEAVELGSKEIMEEMAFSSKERAARGWLEPVYFNGKAVGAKRKFDHDLAWKFLRCEFPDRYNVPTHLQISEGDVAEMLTALALIVSQEAPAELAQRIFDRMEDEVVSKLRAGSKAQVARVIAAEAVEAEE